MDSVDPSAAIFLAIGLFLVMGEFVRNDRENRRHFFWFAKAGSVNVNCNDFCFEISVPEPVCAFYVCNSGFSPEHRAECEVSKFENFGGVIESEQDFLFLIVWHKKLVKVFCRAIQQLTAPLYLATSLQAGSCPSLRFQQNQLILIVRRLGLKIPHALRQRIHLCARRGQ